MTSLTERLAGVRERQFKPRDVEEPIDYYFHRPLASLVVKSLMPLPISPTQVTLLSGLVGMLAGVALAHRASAEPWWALVAAGLLLVSIVLDCADGQLARQRGQASVIGRSIDGMVDVVAPLAIFYGLVFCLHDNGNGGDWVLLNVLGLLVGFSLFWHVNQYDHAKNLYLHQSRPDIDMGGEALLNQKELQRLQEQYAASGERLNAFIIRAMLFYTSMQRTQDKTGKKPALLELQNNEERALFIDLYRKHIRAWSWLGLGSHLFLLNIAVIGSYFGSTYIYAVWIFIAGPLNLICVWLIWQRAALQRKLHGQITGLRETRSH